MYDDNDLIMTLRESFKRSSTDSYKLNELSVRLRKKHNDTNDNNKYENM